LEGEIALLLSLFDLSGILFAAGIDVININYNGK
jgi:hypothetical protein